VFIGHFALAFAAKRAAPRTSLATLVGAAQFADLLWPVLVALGMEHVRIDPGNTRFTPLDFVSYPYSHSLLTLCVWGAALAWIYLRRGGDRRAAVVVGLLVVSHWVLDFATHRPDMPIYPGSPKVGLGLWNSVAATIAVEALLFAAGVAIYVRSTKPRDSIGRWGFAALTVFLVLVYSANIVGGPPPSVAAIWIAGSVGGALLLLWCWWADRHRVSR
jgi:membrane-bound metal-dependent hydrolase YbcI (DUF457 family)